MTLCDTPTVPHRTLPSPDSIKTRNVAAVMVTADHGVRFQHDFLSDVAGGPGGVAPGSPRWLRLTRRGTVITGSESLDGERALVASCSTRLSSAVGTRTRAWR